MYIKPCPLKSIRFISFCQNQILLKWSQNIKSYSTSYGIKWQQTQTYKTLRYSDLHDIDFSANPYSVNCEDVCQVTFIVVILNATKYCNESKVMDWECGLDELTKNFSYKMNSIDMSISTRTYSIRNPVENQKIWLPCTGSSMTKCNRLN